MLLKVFAALSTLGAGLAAGLGEGSPLARGLRFVGVWIWDFLALLLLAVLVLWVYSLFVDPQKPQEKDSRLARTMAKLYAPAVFTILRTKIETTGAEKLPQEGRFVLVCNHINVLDPGVLLAVFPDAQLAFLSKKENLNIPIIGPLMLKIQCQLLDRENDRAALKTILNCIRILKEDRASIGLFPEGYTSKDGHLQPFRNGAFKIPQKANVPIVVCTLRGTREIFHNAAHFRSSRVELRVLEVIPAGELAGLHTNEIGDRVHRLMAQDLGEGEFNPPNA